MIIATAGHIDHGKTVLVEALTGVHTNRLPEEKRRGLSIDLGFAYQEIADGVVIGFVDVPGHERFIHNMLAGVTGIDCALLVVAADDGPMPQTREHLAILDLLEVKRGIVALTKIDRVAAPRIAAVRDQITRLLGQTGLADAPIIPVCALTGQGIPTLRAHLASAAGDGRFRQPQGNFRLAVDRCFSIRGAGLVVTGTVFSGSVRSGDRLIASPRGIPLRVRGVHAGNREAETAGTGQRCALNISGRGLAKETVHRGDWLLAEDAHAPVSRFDARVRVLAGEEHPLRHWTPVHMHLGAADVTGRIAVLSGHEIAPGATGFAQLVLDREIGALTGDRFVLRDRAAARTIGGGRVLDPFAPARGRKRPWRLAFLTAMEREQPGQSLADLLAQSGAGVDLADFAKAWNLTPEKATELFSQTDMVEVGTDRGPLAFSPPCWQALRQQLVAALDDRHRSAPESMGQTEEDLRRSLGGRMRRGVFGKILSRFVLDGSVVRSGVYFRLAGHRPTMDRTDAVLWQRVEPMLGSRGLRPPRVHEIAAALEREAEAVRAFLERIALLGVVCRIAANRFFLPGTVLSLAMIAEELAAQATDGGFSVIGFRDRSGIGRNLTIQVLEYFDNAGFTRRIANGRRILKPATEVFPFAGDGLTIPDGRETHPGGAPGLQIRWGA